MKKLLVLLLALLLVGTLAACGAIPFFGGNDTNTESEEAASPPPEITTLPAEIPDDIEDIEIPDDVPDADEYDTFTIIHDLEGFNLVAHDVTDSDILELIMLRSVLDVNIAYVTIISDWDELIHESGWILNDARAIEIYYFTRRHETAVVSIIGSFEADYDAGFFAPDSYLALGDIHATPDEDMAIFSLVEEFVNGQVRVLVYLGQVIPVTRDVVLMEFVFYPHLWEARDNDILAALSHHIGIDLSVYLADFVSSVV